MNTLIRSTIFPCAGERYRLVTEHFNLWDDDPLSLIRGATLPGHEPPIVQRLRLAQGDERGEPFSDAGR